MVELLRKQLFYPPVRLLLCSAPHAKPVEVLLLFLAWDRHRGDPLKLCEADLRRWRRRDRRTAPRASRPRPEQGKARIAPLKRRHGAGLADSASVERELPLLVGQAVLVNAAEQIQQQRAELAGAWSEDASDHLKVRRCGRATAGEETDLRLGAVPALGEHMDVGHHAELSAGEPVEGLGALGGRHAALD